MYRDVYQHCGGKGKLTPAVSAGTAAPTEEVCPVCKGTGVITVTEILPDPIPYNPYPI